MTLLVPIIIAVSLGIIGLIVYVKTSPKDSSSKSSKNKKSRQVIIREAQKRLKQDQRDPKGLIPLADLYFEENLWEKALDLYKTLVEIVPLHPTIDASLVSFRAGVCALKTENLELAFKNLLVARAKMPDGFDINFYLGQAFFKDNQFDKAIPFLNKAVALNRENQLVHEFLGLALHEKQAYRQAFPHLKISFEANPENKKVLFSMAESLFHCGQTEKSLPVFLHLRADPEYGARSCMYAGTIHIKQKNFEKATKDFEIGLKHSEAPIEVLTNIRYSLAQTYLQLNKISEALSLLQLVNATSPGYKDAQSLIARYQEMSQNASLKTYLVAGSSEFLAMCRKIVSSFYANSHVRIIGMEAKPDVVEIQSEIETTKWEDFVVFRFYRNTGITGDFIIRDFHGRIKDLKAGRGICITAGSFTTETKKFVEGRPIDLLDKESLLKLFNKLSNSKPFAN